MIKLIEPGIFKTVYGTLYTRDTTGTLWKSAGSVAQLRASLASKKVQIDVDWDGDVRTSDPSAAKFDLR